MAELPMGSAGFVCTPRMSALIAQAGSGVLPSDEGGQELRDLYQEGQSFFLYFRVDRPTQYFCKQPLLGGILTCSMVLPSSAT
jgi:hypothetical protein